MALIFPRVPIVFTMSIFEYSPIKWKCRGRSPSPTAWFRQNGWVSVVDSTADFLNSAQLPPFVRVTGNDWFCTKFLLSKRLRAQFVVVRQFSSVGSTFPLVGSTFPLAGSTKLKNNVSKMLIVKSQTVIDCLHYYRTLRNAMTKNYVMSDKLHFHFSDEWAYERVKTMGTRGKIYAIWWNIKINLQKNGRYNMRIWIANKLAKFHAKRLKRSENIPKSFGGYFLNAQYRAGLSTGVWRVHVPPSDMLGLLKISNTSLVPSCKKKRKGRFAGAQGHTYDAGLEI